MTRKIYKFSSIQLEWDLSLYVLIALAKYPDCIFEVDENVVYSTFFIICSVIWLFIGAIKKNIWTKLNWFHMVPITAVLSHFKINISIIFLQLILLKTCMLHSVERTTWKNNTQMSSSLEIWGIFNGAHLAAFPRITKIYVKGERARGEY